MFAPLLQLVMYLKIFVSATLLRLYIFNGIRSILFFIRKQPKRSNPRHPGIRLLLFIDRYLYYLSFDKIMMMIDLFSFHKMFMFFSRWVPTERGERGTSVAWR